jgi:hypothetical protein
MMNFDNWGGGGGSNSSKRRGAAADGLTMIREDEDDEQASSSSQQHHLDVLSQVYPEDGRLVGTDAIFTSSPNVVPHHCSDVDSNPHKRMGVPTPSIYTETGVRYTISKSIMTSELTYSTPNGDTYVAAIYTPIHNVTLYSVVNYVYGH